MAKLEDLENRVSFLVQSSQQTERDEEEFSFAYCLVILPFQTNRLSDGTRNMQIDGQVEEHWSGGWPDLWQFATAQKVCQRICQIAGE